MTENSAAAASSAAQVPAVNVTAAHVSAEPGTAVEIALRWGDMDVNNHINNVQFARLFEEARVRCFQQWFTDAPYRQPVFVVRQDIEFRAPLDYTPEPVVVRGWISHVGNSSFALTMVLSSHEGVECAVAETRMVVVGEAGRPTPLTSDARELLTAQLSDSPGVSRR